MAPPKKEPINIELELDGMFLLVILKELFLTGKTVLKVKGGNLTINFLQVKQKRYKKNKENE